MDDSLADVWEAVALTLKLAVTSTLILLVLATPLAWVLARSRRWWMEIVGAITALPLVLPPTVLGFYLLLAMAPDGPISTLLRPLGVPPLAFSFPGLVVGSVIYSLPFAVQPIRDAFAAIGARPMEAAATLRAGPLDRFFTVALPLARPGLVSAAVLSFAHTVGEFGVVLMIGGNIPHETRVISIAIFSHVENQEYHAAHLLAGGLVVFSFAVVLTLRLIQRAHRRAGLSS